MRGGASRSRFPGRSRQRCPRSGGSCRARSRRAADGRASRRPRRWRGSGWSCRGRAGWPPWGEEGGEGQVDEELIDPVDRERAVDRGPQAERQLGVGPVQQGLEEHPAGPEAGVLVDAPRPHRQVRVGGREGFRGHGRALGQPVGVSALLVREPQVHFTLLRGFLDARPQQHREPPLDAACVLDEVGQRPAGATGYRCRQVGVLDHCDESGGLRRDRRAMVDRGETGSVVGVVRDLHRGMPFGAGAGSAERPAEDGVGVAGHVEGGVRRITGPHADTAERELRDGLHENERRGRLTDGSDAASAHSLTSGRVRAAGPGRAGPWAGNPITRVRRRLPPLRTAASRTA